MATIHELLAITCPKCGVAGTTYTNGTHYNCTDCGACYPIKKTVIKPQPKAPGKVPVKK